MRRTGLVLAIAGLLVAVFAGIAPAATQNCERGGPGPNRMVGGPDRDALCGEDGNDTILGRGGNDALVGGGDNDRISGEDGDDKLKGGRGADELDGGPGDDILRPGMFHQPNDGARDTVRCGGGTDTVYVTGMDRVSGDCENRR